MPVVQTLPALSSPPTNAWGLFQYLAQRVPGYDSSEYLRELNSAYIHVWEEVSKLKNQYFTNIKVVSVTASGYNFDLQFNSVNAANTGTLTAAISSRLYQVTKIRVQPPAGGLFQTTKALQPNHPDFSSLSANASSTPTQTGPYYWYLSGRGQLNFGLPLAVGSNLEVTYTFWPISLTFLSNGSVSSATNVVTGVGTNFTSLLQPDFQTYLPAIGNQEEIQAEIVCNGTLPTGGQIYRITGITSDTALTTFTAINPVLASGSPYVLATFPEIPREHIRVIASKALATMYLIDGDDARSGEASQSYATNLLLMKDALIERQGQDPPQKIRFPYGIARRNRTFMR